MTTSIANSLPGKQGHILAFVAGLIMPLAFAPFSLYPLALISLSILFILWQHLP
ncbi:MAG: apolipoprotein N-acyltransferase, partial [Gammaproteobacteria bacterium]|nr:apolipoprotein N-acyltransferase [Gammaproteobacteria bacterium]